MVVRGQVSTFDICHLFSFSHAWLKRKGLIVLSGCAHSGIVNTIEYAKRFANINTIHAVIGGFHLARANDDEIEQTIDYFREVDPSFIIPSHCTGFRAKCRFAQEFPDQFIEGVVGTTYLFNNSPPNILLERIPRDARK